MRTSIPEIISYEDLIESWGPGLTKVLSKSGKSTTPRDLKHVQNQVLSTIMKSRKCLEEMEDDMLKFHRLMVVLDPKVYVSRSKDVKTGIEYFLAKTFWPIRGGRKKEVKIFLGKSSDYNNDTRSKRAKNEAVEKMRQTLARRIREESI